MHLPPNYATTRAAAKWGALEQQLREHAPAPLRWPSVQEIKDRLGRAERTADEAFAESSDFTADARLKTVHRHGAAAVALFHPAASGFTGLYAQDAARVVVRFSYAYDPALARPPFEPYHPGVALKFLVDEARSENLLFLSRFQGVPREGFFGTPLDTALAPHDDTKEFVQLTRLNEAVRRHVRMERPADDRTIPCDGPGKVTVAGARVAEPKVPDSIRLEHDPSLAQRWADLDPGLDFRDRLNLATRGHEGRPLFRLIARAAGGETDLGEVRLFAPLCANPFVDEQLRFQHPWGG